MIGPIASLYTLSTVTTPRLYTSRIMWESIWPWGERERGRQRKEREREEMKESRKKELKRNKSKKQWSANLRKKGRKKVRW